MPKTERSIQVFYSTSFARVKFVILIGCDWQVYISRYYASVYQYDKEISLVAFIYPSNVLDDEKMLFKLSYIFVPMNLKVKLSILSERSITCVHCPPMAMGSNTAQLAMEYRFLKSISVILMCIYIIH